MNFKKTLGLVLTAALVSTSLVAVKPAKAAAPTATASTNINFNYFFPERSLLVDGEADTYVVDTDYAGKVQYEFWVKDTTNKDAKWQVVSADANGKPGYTEAQDGQNAPYAIKLKDGFSFKQGKYMTAVYVKVAGTDGTKTYKHYMDPTTGVDTGDAKTGTEQKYDGVKTGYFNAMSQSYKQKYKEMLGDFTFDPATLIAGTKTTFKGFSSASGAKYKLVVRKFGDPASKQTVLNPDAFQETVDWTPKDAGTYQVIAWSEPINAKGAARDGWRIGTVTVKAAATKAEVDPSSIQLKVNQPILGETLVSLKLTGAADPTKCTVKFQGTTLKYYASTGMFSGVVSSNDESKLKDVSNYTVDDNSTPAQQVTVDASSIELKVNQPILGETLVSLKLTGATDPTKCTVKFGDTTLKYYASTGKFSGVVSSNDETTLKNAASYTVTAQ